MIALLYPLFIAALLFHASYRAYDNALIYHENQEIIERLREYGGCVYERQGVTAGAPGAMRAIVRVEFGRN